MQHLKFKITVLDRFEESCFGHDRSAARERKQYMPNRNRRGNESHIRMSSRVHAFSKSCMRRNILSRKVQTSRSCASSSPTHQVNKTGRRRTQRQNLITCLTFRTPGGGVWNARLCSFGETEEWRGRSHCKFVVTPTNNQLIDSSKTRFNFVLRICLL
jgi:hypothetical protein